LTEESLQQDIFDLGETSPPKPKKKSLGGRDVFVKALSHGTDPSILRMAEK